jgi:CHAD domain-containing protein/CYTH domain-containing protein
VADYPTGLLPLPPQLAVERIGTLLLDEAAEAVGRLHGGDDEEALHDFRVALRRLRSVLRAFRPHLDHAVTKKTRSRIRDLARTTNSARDAEVLLEWVQTRRQGLTPTQRIGARWFAERLEHRRDEGYADGERAIARDFTALDRRIRRRLAAAARNPWGGSEARPTFAAALSDLVRDHVRSLCDKVDHVRDARDDATVHAARIEAKRLRYLLELVGGEIEAAASGVKRLKRLQTVLGDLHDVQVADSVLGSACEDAAAEHARTLAALVVGQVEERERRRVRRRNPTTGLLALTRASREAQQELFERFDAWRREEEDGLRGEIDQVIDTLGVVSPAGVEIERKYLLRAVPEHAASAVSVAVEQGWLPGSKLQERLRHVSGGDGEHYVRTVKLGAGLSRLEVEEETSAELFRSLWPLTEGRRVRKRRYYVPEGDRTWEIDEFLDRELVLAEVELPSPQAEVEIPDWLAPVLERDVTGDPDYLNVNLAR